MFPRRRKQSFANAKNLSLVKRGAYLIDTACGAVVETPALVDA